MKKTKILILGGNGMLGYGVNKTINKTNEFSIINTTRNKSLINSNTIFFDVLTSNLTDLPKDIDYIINCIGVIKPHMENNTYNAILINSLFPHKLSSYCNENNIKLIHITTDCVFSGLDGKYDEDSLHDPKDAYGKSKSLGEPSDCMVIRTSIVGEESHNFSSLISWTKSMNGKTVYGYNNHLWNGVTTNYFGELCYKIIKDGLYSNGLYHIFSNDVSKYEMLTIFNKKWDLNLTILPFYDKLDRTLRTKKELNNIVMPPSFIEMIQDL